MAHLSLDLEIAPLPPADTLLQVRTGKIQQLGTTSFKSAISKTPRTGKILVTEVGLVGDQQQYEFHGGVDKALHQYSAAHYPVWHQENPSKAHLYQIGGFGENLSSEKLSEENVCIGDVFKVGEEVVVQVSEPRQPCYKLNTRFEWRRASVRTQQTGRTGWYLRVLKTGSIEAGDRFELVERPNPMWSIANVQRFLYRDTGNVEAMTRLSKLEGLGSEIRKLFQKRLMQGQEDFTGRLKGLEAAITWRKYKLVEKAALTIRVKKFIFAIVDDSEVDDPEFKAFPYVRLRFGPKNTIIRAYSVVEGNIRRFELGIARDDNSRGGSVYLHDNLQAGDVIEIAKGHDAPTMKDDNSKEIKEHVFIIGGIGITAFLPEFKKLEASRAHYHIHYAVRSTSEAPYLDHLNLEKAAIYAKDQSQRLDIASVIPAPNPEMQHIHATKFYICGPASLTLSCKARLASLSYPASHVRIEDFGGASLTSGEAFEVQISSSGQVLQVQSDRTLLQTLNKAGFEVPSSCEAGNCGVCVVDYLRGDIEHRGVGLAEEEKGNKEKGGCLLSCVSRGRGRVMLDL